MTEPGLENVKNTNRMRIAVAQSTVPEDPGDVPALRAAGEEIRTLIHEAADGGARLVQFPEGALVYPHKRAMSSSTTTLAEADWTRANWTVLHEEAEAIAHTAAEVGIWVAFGTVRPLTPPHRPHNSFYLISDTGEVAARHDKRILSHTELTWMYTPGKYPVVVDIDGFRFGIALCIEANFPELFAEYETLDVRLRPALGHDRRRDPCPHRPVLCRALQLLGRVRRTSPVRHDRPPPASPHPADDGKHASPPKANRPWPSPTSTATPPTTRYVPPSNSSSPGDEPHDPASTPPSRSIPILEAKPSRRSETHGARLTGHTAKSVERPTCSHASTSPPWSVAKSRNCLTASEPSTSSRGGSGARTALTIAAAAFAGSPGWPP